MAEKGKSKIAKLMDQSSKLQSTFENLSDAVEKSVSKQLEKYGDLVNAEETRAYQMKMRLEEEKKMVSQMDDIVQSLEKQKDATEEQKEEARKLLESYDQQRQITEEIVKNLEGVTEGLESAATMGENLAGELFGINGRTEELGKALSRNNKYLSNSVRWWGKIGKSMTKQLTTANLVANANMKAFEALKQGALSAKKYIEDMSPIGKAWDQAKQFRTEMRLLSRDINIVTHEAMLDQSRRIEEIAETTRSSSGDIARVMGTMYKSSAAFRQEQPELQQALATTGKLIEKRLNVPVGNSAKMFETLTRLQGMTAKESENVTTSFVATARKLKMDVNPLTANFEQMQERLAKYSLPNTSKEILKMQHIQDATGISMDKMMGSMESLTTFEGALTAASRLNILLGTQIDGMELNRLANQSALKGMSYLRNEIGITTEEWDKMGFAERRAITEPLNMDPAQFQKFLATPIEKFNELVAETEGTYVSASDAMAMLHKDHAIMATDQEEEAAMVELQRKNIQGLADAQENLKRQFQEFLRANAWAQWASMAVGAIAQVVGSLAGLIMDWKILNAVRAGGTAASVGSTAAAAGSTAAAAGSTATAAGTTAAAAGTTAATVGVSATAAVLAPIAAVLGGGAIGYAYADEIADALGFGDKEVGKQGVGVTLAPGQKGLDNSAVEGPWGEYSGIGMAQKSGYLFGQMQGGHGSVQGGPYALHPNETTIEPLRETAFTKATTYLPPNSSIDATPSGATGKTLTQNINLYLDGNVVASVKTVKDLSDSIEQWKEDLSLTMNPSN